MYKPVWDWTWGGTTDSSRTCLGGSLHKEYDGTQCTENFNPVFVRCQQESSVRICVILLYNQKT